MCSLGRPPMGQCASSDSQLAQRANPKPPCFPRCEHIACREREQLANALEDGPYMALVTADTQKVFMGRWCMKLTGLIAPELLSKNRGFRRSVFASLDGEGSLLLVTTERRLKAFLFGRTRQCPECDGLAHELIIELLDGDKPWSQWKCVLDAIERRSDKLDRQICFSDFASTSFFCCAPKCFFWPLVVFDCLSSWSLEHPFSSSKFWFPANSGVETLFWFQVFGFLRFFCFGLIFLVSLRVC